MSSLCLAAIPGSVYPKRIFLQCGSGLANYSITQSEANDELTKMIQLSKMELVTLVLVRSSFTVTYPFLVYVLQLSNIDHPDCFLVAYPKNLTDKFTYRKEKFAKVIKYSVKFCTETFQFISEDKKASHIF